MTNKIQHFPSRLWRLLFLALPLAACTSEMTDEDLPAGASPIAFRVPEVTKAVVENFTSGDAFSVWGWYGDDATNLSTNVFDNVTVTNSNGSWTYSPYRYWVADKEYRFYAVYPATVGANVEANGTITVTDFDASKTGAEAVDLMTASAEAKESDKAAVAFTFNHELCRINFIADAMPDVNVTITSASLYGMSTAGDLTNNGTSSWNLDAPVDEANTTFTYSSNLVINDETDLFGDILMIPQPVGSGIKLKITYRYGGETADRPPFIADLLSASMALQNGWEKGKYYRYTFEIGSDEYILFDKPSVNGWNEASGGNITIE